jgi:hypothetical protein
VVKASERLGRVEGLLDRAVDDLAGRSMISGVCVSALSEAVAELQSLESMWTNSSQQPVQRAQLRDEECAALKSQVKGLVSRLGDAERLLAAAGEFYRGWCAAGLAPSLVSPGYQTNGWSQGPALLTLVG